MSMLIEAAVLLSGVLRLERVRHCNCCLLDQAVIVYSMVTSFYPTPKASIFHVAILYEDPLSSSYSAFVESR